MQNKIVWKSNQPRTPPTPERIAYARVLKHHRALLQQCKHREPTAAEIELMRAYLDIEERHAKAQELAQTIR